MRVASRAVADMPGYSDGRWWVQDLAASLPARLIANGHKNVLDLCAAPGGKTAQLAAEGAKVTAVDLSFDRMKRVIAEQCPTFFGGDPDTFAAGLAYERRSVDEELTLLAAVRRHMTTILRELKAADFQRTGNHSEAGTMTLEALLRNIAEHVPHHVRFIAEKRQALGV